MTKFVVDLRAIHCETIEVDADSPADAVAQAYEQRRNYVKGIKPEAVSVVDGQEFWHVVGSCEACESVLFDGDDYLVDEDGVQTCRQCAVAAGWIEPA